MFPAFTGGHPALEGQQPMTRGKLLLFLLAHLPLGGLAFWPVHFKTDAEFWSRVLDAGHLP